MNHKQISYILAIALFCQPVAPVLAADSFLPSEQTHNTSGRYSAQDFQDSILRTTRLLQQKQEQELLAENRTDERRTDLDPSLTVDPAPSEEFGASSLSLDAQGVNPPSSSIYQWLSQLQAPSSTGLVESFPEDNNINQSFTYDQALAGITLLKENDNAGAQKIFNFFNANWDGSGFWTVYNTQAVDGYKVEYHRVMGPTAWIGLFCLLYYRQTGDSDALDLATNIGKWIGTLPHQDGGVAMGANDPAHGPNWGTIYSVENNLDYYALASLLSRKAVSSSDRAFFNTEKINLKLWFQTKAYDTGTGLFKRGPSSSLNDTTYSLDTNTWAFSAFGVDGVKDLLGFNDLAISGLVTRIENTFAVQPNGTFGGNILTAKGFDFAYIDNAARIGRQGIVWVEGTNQMILVYKQLADYYRTAGNTVEADKYQARADHFLALNANYHATDGTSYVYSDSPNTRVFWDVGGWNTAPGAAVPSTMWVYLASNGFNPFTPFQIKNLSAPIHFAGSTSKYRNDDISFDLGLDFQATVRYKFKSYSAYFDPDLLTMSFTSTPAETGYTSETFLFRLNEAFNGSSWSYSLDGMIRSLGRSDGSSYDFGYDFFSDGTLRRESLTQNLVGYTHDWSADYTYLTAGGQQKVDTQVITTHFNGHYGYATATDFDYDLLGQLSRITITQETHNDPVYRILESYAYVFNLDGSLSFLSLGKQYIAY